MNLMEEYYNRHNLNLKPIVYVDFFNLIYKTHDEEKVLFSCELLNEENAPNKYMCGRFKFIHNGWLSRQHVSKKEDSIFLFWDEYERYLLDFVYRCKERKFKVASNEMECHLWGWEAFLLVYDSFLCSKFDMDFWKLAGESCNNTIALSSRYDFMRWTLDIIDKKHPKIRHDYDKFFYSLKESHPIWLANLILT
jgi:hypothetical protein